MSSTAALTRNDYFSSKNIKSGSCRTGRKEVAGLRGKEKRKRSVVCRIRRALLSLQTEAAHFGEPLLAGRLAPFNHSDQAFFNRLDPR